jgi:hypothetical protein
VRRGSLASENKNGGTQYFPLELGGIFAPQFHVPRRTVQAALTASGRISFYPNVHWANGEPNVVHSGIPRNCSPTGLLVGTHNLGFLAGLLVA